MIAPPMVPKTFYERSRVQIVVFELSANLKMAVQWLPEIPDSKKLKEDILR
jgi:hypothetical protein